jgi:hypothetical protein
LPIRGVFCGFWRSFAGFFWGIFGVFGVRKSLISRVIPRYSTKFHR